MWTLLLDRFKVTLLLSVFILIAGFLAYRDIPREITPTIEIPAATVTTVWPGASAGDVEKLITNKIEKEIKNLENLKQYQSISRSGVSVVNIEFEVGTNLDANIQRLREKIDTAEKELPDTILDDPDINEVSISDIPVASVTISGDFSWSELKQFAETLEDEFLTIPKVKDVQVKGAPEDEVHILIDPVKLEANNLGVNEVIEAIRASHRDMPLGEVFVDGQKVEVTLRGELEQAIEFMNVPIKKVGRSLIQLRDVGVVRREFEKFNVETLYFTGDQTSRRAVLIDVVKSASKGNVVKMVDQVRGKIHQLKEKSLLPPNLHTEVTYDRGENIQESLDTLTRSGGQTLILIGIVMLLALGWRESILASFSIPLAMLIGILVLFMSGETFNGVSLFALVLSIGLLVDNAIIIVEGISSGIFEKRLRPREAAVETIKTFRWPIITGTLTTVFAFLPLLYFISGISGQYVSVIPKTVITILLGALFVSLFLLPSLGRYFFRRFAPTKPKESRLLHGIQAWYETKMKAVLVGKASSVKIILISLAVFFFSVSLLITRQVLVEVFPGADDVFFTAKVEFPEGTSLEETRGLIPQLEKSIQPFFQPQASGDVWMKNVVFTVGQRSSAVSRPEDFARQPQEHILGITFNLTPKNDRQTKSYDMIEPVKKALQDVIPHHGELELTEVRGGPPTGAPVEVRLLGDDLVHLELMAEQVLQVLKGHTETLNVRDSRADRITQVIWKFDRDVLANFGLRPREVSEVLRSAVNGLTVVELVEGDEEVDVDLRIDWEGNARWDDPRSLDKLERTPLKTPTGEFIAFRQIAHPHLTSELSAIEHEDGKRVIFVRSDLKKGVPASKLTPFLQETINNLEVRPGEVVELAGESEEGNRLITETSRAMMFALLLILVVLVWQFNSFAEALIILALIPLSLTGVFIGFWLTNLTITFPTMIGIVSLAGIIVNDAIVLIDQINVNKRSGLSSIAASIQAGKDRLQPIALTSITTVVGLLPLSLSDEVWAGLGFSIIFGMMLSTVLTLLLVPCFLRLIPTPQPPNSLIP